MSDLHPRGSVSKGLTLPERRIPVPTSIGPEAQTALATSRPAPPPVPALDDKAAWRSTIERFNGAFADRIAQLCAPLPGRATSAMIGGVPTYIGDADDVPAGNRDKAMIFFHGGGLVMAGGRCVEFLARLEADKTRCRVYAVDFRNPPDHPFPAALEDGVAVYRALLTRYDPARIVIAGASGGGNLAAAVPLKARDLGLPLPGAVGLFTPEVDLTESGDSFETNRGIDVNGGDLSAFNALYADGHDLTDPYLSPLFGDYTKGFPPTFIQTGTRDMFLSNAVRMHRVLRRAGVVAELHVGEAMPHGGFGGGLRDLPEDQELRLEFRGFLATHAAWARPAADAERALGSEAGAV